MRPNGFIYFDARVIYRPVGLTLSARLRSGYLGVLLQKNQAGRYQAKRSGYPNLVFRKSPHLRRGSGRAEETHMSWQGARASRYRASGYADARFEGHTLNRCLSIPRLAIFDSRVWCGIPSSAAAPRGPETRPWHSANAASIAFLSRPANSFLSSARTPARETCCAERCFDFPGSQVSSTENASPSHRITARSTTFCSSRMFPGQS